jgi:hypothetical protein
MATIRCQPMKEKVNGGTRSDGGRDWRDACLGLRRIESAMQVPGKVYVLPAARIPVCFIVVL